MKTNKTNHIKYNIFRIFIICGLCIMSYFLGYNYNKNTNVKESKDQIIMELNTKYNQLQKEHKKSQDLIDAITSEIKRLTQELKEYKNVKNSELIFDEKNNSLGLAMVSDHIKTNEAFSSRAYCDSDGKYRNGYGTLAKIVKYNIGDTVEVRDCKGKITNLIASEKNQYLPESKISEAEALSRKEAHLIKHVFPYLYGKRFRSTEEFIVATDVIYNRGIAQSKELFNTDGTINCKSLYKYMDHSKAKYQQTIRKRYAKNYALCIQS